ncbi:hypothetical protein P7C71_g6163, partial [Lecanoromycetidae sp. Uapishka_2]
MADTLSSQITSSSWDRGLKDILVQSRSVGSDSDDEPSNNGTITLSANELLLFYEKHARTIKDLINAFDKSEANLKEEKNAHRKDVEAVQKQLNEKDAYSKILERELENLKKVSEADLKKEKDNHRTDVEAVQKQFNEQKEYSKKLEGDLERLQKALDSKDDLSKWLFRLQNELESTKQSLSAARKDSDDARAELKAVQKQLMEQKEYSKKLEDELKKSKNVPDDKDELGKWLFRLQNELESTKQSLTAARKDAADARAELAKVQAANKVLEAAKKELEKTITEVTKLLSKENHGHKA